MVMLSVCGRGPYRVTATTTGPWSGPAGKESSHDLAGLLPATVGGDADTSTLPGEAIGLLIGSRRSRRAPGSATVHPVNVCVTAVPASAVQAPAVPAPAVRTTAVPRRRALRLAAAATVLAVGLAGCSGGSGSGSAASVGDVLAKAKTSLDQATTVHFVLSSKDVPAGEGTKLVGGDGFAVRPKAFKGSLKLIVSGSAVTIELVSIGGKVYVKSPFAPGFAIVDPKDFGLKDPATLVDQKNGVVRLITSMTDAKLTGEGRVGKDVVQQVQGKVPGQVVKDLLASADPSQPVTINAAVDKKTGQLRQADLTGPFFKGGQLSTFTIVFDRYGEQVDVTAPPLG